MKKATRLSPGGFQDFPLMLAYASVRSESVTDTEVVADRVLCNRRERHTANSNRGRVEGRAANDQSSAVLVVHVAHRCVQSRTLRQVVHVAQSPLVSLRICEQAGQLV